MSVLLAKLVPVDVVVGGGEFVINRQENRGEHKLIQSLRQLINMPAVWIEQLGKADLRSAQNSGGSLVSHLSSSALEMPLFCSPFGSMPLRLSSSPELC